MNTKSAILVALLAVVILPSLVVNAAPGELGSQCKGWIGGPAPFTFCSDKVCNFPAMLLISRCNGGLHCCVGPGGRTTTAKPTVASPSTPSGTATAEIATKPTEPQAQPQAQAQPEAQPQALQEVKPEAKPEVKPETKPEAQPPSS